MRACLRQRANLPRGRVLRRRCVARRPQRRTRGVEAPLRAVRHPACVFGSMGDVLRRRNSTHNQTKLPSPKGAEAPCRLCLDASAAPLTNLRAVAAFGAMNSVSVLIVNAVNTRSKSWKCLATKAVEASRLPVRSLPSVRSGMMFQGIMAGTSPQVFQMRARGRAATWAREAVAAARRGLVKVALALLRSLR